MEDVDKSTTSKMASSTTISYGFAKRPGCDISPAMWQLANQNVLQQQHVDHKITHALLKRGTRDAYKRTSRGTSMTAAWVDMRFTCTSRTTRADSASTTTPSQGTLRRISYTTNARFVAFVGTFAPLLNRSGCRATTSRIQPPGMPHLSARYGVCTTTSCSTTTAPISRQQHSPPRRPAPAQEAALLPTRAQTRSLRTQNPRTTATANSFFRSSTASTRHSNGVRFPPRCLPTLRTSSPVYSLVPAPFRRNAVDFLPQIQIKDKSQIKIASVNVSSHGHAVHALAEPLLRPVRRGLVFNMY